MSLASLGSLKRHVASSSAWALGLHLTSSVAAVAVTALLSRQLGPENLGSWILLSSVVMAVATIAGLGLPESLVRATSKLQTEGRNDAASTQIVQAFLLTAAALVAVAVLLNLPRTLQLISSFAGQSADWRIGALMTIWVATWSIQTLASACFRGMHDIRLATFFAGLCRNGLLLLILGVLTLGSFEVSLNSAISAMVLALVGGNLFALSLLRKKVLPHKKDYEKSLGKQLSDSWPFLMNLLILLIIARAGLWSLGAFSTRSEVALLGIVLQLMVLVSLPLFVMNAVLPPVISSLHAAGNQQEKLERTIRSVTSLACIPALGVFLVMLFFGRPLIEQLFGEFYGAAAPVLVVLALGQCANVIAGPSGTLLKMTDHQHELFRVNLVFGVITVLLSIAAASRYGALGIAVVTTLVLTTQNIYTIALAYRRTGVLCCAYFTPKQLILLARSAPAGMLTRSR